MSDTGQRIRKIVKTLESGRITDIYNALVELRKKFINPESAYILRDHELMKLITPYVENPKLANISLSIISNACLYPCLRDDVMRNDGVKYLVRVMKTLANDSIQNRACRALGNIALCQEGLALVHKYKAAPHIITLLTTTDDKDCKQTAIRTLRILGAGPAHCNKIISEKGVFAICKLLHSEDTDIIQCAIKAVASLTNQCEVKCANQVREAECLKVLVELADHSEESIKHNALKCLGNVSRQSAMRSELGDAGAISVFFRVANSNSEYTEVKSAILSLCFCCREVKNNQKIRESDVFPLLLRALSDEKYSELHENIVWSLLCFRFDTSDIEGLAECEIIKVLTNLLQGCIDRYKSEFCSDNCGLRQEFEKMEFVGLIGNEKTMPLGTDQKEELPKRYTMPHSRFLPTSGSPISNSAEKFGVYDFGCLNERHVVSANSNSFCKRDKNPGQCSQSNPSKKVCLEKGAKLIFTDSSSTSDNQKGGKRKMSENFQLERSHLPPNACSSVNHERKHFMKNNLVHYIICLLNVLSKNLKIRTKVTEKTCIEVLTDCLILLPEPEEKVQQIFVNLLQDGNCFERLIYFNFFAVLDEKTKLCSAVMDCRRCSKLIAMKKVLKDKGATVAGSGYGIGTFSHLLLRGNKRTQLNSIYTFANLVNDKSSLRKLLIDADGLSVLLEFLTCTEPATFAPAAVSLSRIYHCLSNKPRYIDEKSQCHKKKTSESEGKNSCYYFSCSHDVSFKLDSSDVVEASRSILCEKSDFFRALLQGHFSEANKSVVNLSGVSRAALSATFHFLHGCSEDSCDFIKNIEFDVLLELLCVFDKYFILEFKQSVEKQLLNNMDMRKAQKIYVSSTKYNFPELAEHAFHFILLADDIEREELLKCTRCLLDSSDVSFLDEIRYTLKDMLPGSRDHPLYTRRNSTSFAYL